jgi:prepilin-type N-terminal cleavage/methylation domain-containing protein
MQKDFSDAKRGGFSLVELSIVLVILGLLTGGILTGQNLIRAAELRSVITEFKTYQTAVMTFRDKYFALPGDMRNATDFWNSAGGAGVLGDGCEAATGSGTETCNGDGDGDGDGDGIITYGSLGASEYNETFTFWQHLTNAGLIEGSYTGIAGDGGLSDSILGENVPSSRVGQGGWSAVTRDPVATHFDRNYGGTLFIGGQVSGGTTYGKIFSPEEGPIGRFVRRITLTKNLP